MGCGFGAGAGGLGAGGDVAGGDVVDGGVVVDGAPGAGTGVAAGAALKRLMTSAVKSRPGSQ